MEKLIDIYFIIGFFGLAMHFFVAMMLYREGKQWRKSYSYQSILTFIVFLSAPFVGGVLGSAVMPIVAALILFFPFSYHTRETVRP